MDLNEEHALNVEIGLKEKTFKSLGVVDKICKVCEKLKWKTPTAIQQEAIPLALQSRDIFGLAETGSGKTAAFVIPVLQALLQTPERFFAVVLTPTAELAFQIGEQFGALGASMGVIKAVIVDGMELYDQTRALARKPHVIIATPGTLIDHLENTKGFSLKTIKFLIMDEADGVLDMDLDEVNKILQAIPQKRHTYIYSATMNDEKLRFLKRAFLTNPANVKIVKKHPTVEKLEQFTLFVPFQQKDVYLVHVLNELPGDSIMIFCATCMNTQRTAFLLRNLGFTAIPLYNKLSQAERRGALQKFKSRTRSILIATDVASRGLDIPHVDVVINLDIPSNSKDYIHRVGRTARDDRRGKSIIFVTQRSAVLYQKIELLIQKKLPLYPTVSEKVMALLDRVAEAQFFANKEMKKLESKNKRRRRKNVDDDDYTEKSRGVKRFNKKKLKN